MTQHSTAQIPFGLHPELVLGRYCAMTGATRTALAGSDKTREITMLRHEAMWLMRQLTSASQEAIGRHFGDRDMATVHAGIARVADPVAVGFRGTTSAGVSTPVV
ncbi:helix-turn-helix domain-containing protein [Neotabrizicola sp. sgz301269]|uniref:helix-turn-helix domain-containing protein n=1 Tax=Neotabrizicola sp. sgz301269 TaxID=3276282 RepID=UPI00376F5FF2